MMATPQNQFRYCALPAEIRNQIMEYVLIPGDVYIRPTNRTPHAQHPWKASSSRLKRFVGAMASLSRHLFGQPQCLVTDTADVRLKGQSTIQQAGCQFLETCKQAYNDGHYTLYAINTFHGRLVLSVTQMVGTNLQPEHRKMIKTICIDLDNVELMGRAMDVVEASARRRRGGRLDDYDRNAWSWEATFHLELRIWTQILGLYCCPIRQNLRGFVGLGKVIVGSCIGRCVLNSQFWTEQIEWESLGDFVTAASLHFEAVIQFHVDGVGWRQTKKWLEGLSRTRLRA